MRVRKVHSTYAFVVIMLGIAICQRISAQTAQAAPPNEYAEVTVARKAARAFCEKFNFPPEKIRELEGKPLFQTALEHDDGTQVLAVRWLGGGRGDYIVQVEVYTNSMRVVAYGGYNHIPLGALVYRNDDGTLARPDAE